MSALAATSKLSAASGEMLFNLRTNFLKNPYHIQRQKYLYKKTNGSRNRF
jgi:hypothetical protein